MMANNLETENKIGNNFNRRIRQSESGQPLEELKTEDKERTEKLKLLLNNSIKRTSKNKRNYKMKHMNN